jgi:hypothetical protein
LTYKKFGAEMGFDPVLSALHSIALQRVFAANTFSSVEI